MYTHVCFREKERWFELKWIYIVSALNYFFLLSMYESIFMSDGVFIFVSNLEGSINCTSVQTVPEALLP